MLLKERNPVRFRIHKGHLFAITHATNHDNIMVRDLFVRF